jgi:hypothetical protein
MCLFDRCLLALDKNMLHVFVRSKTGRMIKIVQCELLLCLSHTRGMNITLLHTDRQLSVQFHVCW